MSSEYSFINELFSIMFINYYVPTKLPLMFASVGCFIDRMIKMRLKIDVCVCVTQITRTTVTSENLLLIQWLVIL